MIQWMLAIWSSAFSESSLNIRKFSVHVLLKLNFKDFEDNLDITWNECNCRIIWMLFGIAFLGIGMKIALFQSCGHWSFPSLLAYWVQHFNSIIFRTWNSSAGVKPHPLALFLVRLPKAHLTSHFRISGSRWVTTPLWLSGSLRDFLYRSVCSCHLFLISSASVKSLPFVLYHAHPRMKCSLYIFPLIF